MKLVARRSNKRNFNHPHKDLYFWCNRNHWQHEQSLDPANSFLIIEDMKMGLTEEVIDLKIELNTIMFILLSILNKYY